MATSVAPPHIAYNGIFPAFIARGVPPAVLEAFGSPGITSHIGTEHQIVQSLQTKLSERITHCVATETLFHPIKVLSRSRKTFDDMQTQFIRPVPRLTSRHRGKSRIILNSSNWQIQEIQFEFTVP